MIQTARYGFVHVSLDTESGRMTASGIPADFHPEVDAIMGKALLFKRSAPEPSPRPTRSRWPTTTRWPSARVSPP